jgi:hypothetical protein
MEVKEKLHFDFQPLTVVTLANEPNMVCKIETPTLVRRHPFSASGCLAIPSTA